MSRPVRYGLTISEEELGPKAPVLIQGGLAGAVRRASELGFDSVEIHVRNPSSLDIGALSRAASETGVEISAVGTGLEYSLNRLCLTAPESSLRRSTVDRFHEHIGLASNFGATVFVGLCRGVAPEASLCGEYLTRLAEVLVPLAEYADERGVTLSIEPIASYMTNLLTTTRETLEFLDHAGLETVLLLMDTHHMYLEDGDLGETFRMCGDRIGHLHISDSDRKYPGSGKIDYTLVGALLKEIRYDRAVSLEVLPEPDGETAALKGLAWMRSVWGD